MFLRNLSFMISVYFLMKIKLATGTVTFENHAYRQIDVAIGESVPYDLKLIEQIKAMFTEGSKVLFKATYQKAYFGQVNIWVPPTWSIPTETKGGNVSLKVNDNWFEDADLRLDQEPHPIHGDHPYTLQPRGCGEPGLYMHLTTNFFKNPAKHGNPGRVLVHEWAHYRYGVFNEYSDADDAHQFYLNTNKSIKATLCSRHVKGWFLENGSQSCTKDLNGYPTKKCSFYPDTNRNANENVTASLMSIPYLKNVEFFCSDDEHNDIAPTKQNEMCNQSSTWSVISSHPDFKNLDASTVISNTSPVFHLFQSKRPELKQVVIALVDMSKTMTEKLETVKDSLKSFVKYRLPRSVEFAVLGFSSLYDDREVLNYTKVFQNFIAVEQQTDILENIDRMSVNTTSQSNNSRPNGEALKSTLKYIKEQLRNPANASVLLITDGHTNSGPYVIKVLPKLIAAELQVNFIALGFEVQPDLKEKIVQTSGELYSVEVAKDKSTIKPLHQFDSVFLQIASRIGSVHVTPLWENTVILRDGQTSSGLFVAEKIGQISETDVFICAKEKKTFTLTIRNAAKVLVYRNSSSCHFTSVQMVGKMAYSLNYTKTKGHDKLTLSVIISSRCLKHQVAPTQVLSQRYIPPITVYPAVPKAYLILTKGYYAPIIKAEINFTACSSGPVNNSCQTFQLRDDGKGVDNFENDGIYSAVTNYIKNNGSYSTSFTVGKVNGTVLIRRKKIPRTGAPVFPELSVENTAEEARDSLDPGTLAQAQDEHVDSENDDFAIYDMEPVDDFFRESFTGSSQASGYMLAVDNIQPAYVRDLKVTAISLANKAKFTQLAVSLEWTSSGDDEFEGIADYIEMRYAYSPDLRQNFEQGTVIIPADLQEGESLNPQHPRTKHSLKIRVKSNQHDESMAFVIFFVVQTCDEARNCEKSNVAMAYLKIDMANSLLVTGIGISSGTLTLLAVFGIIFILAVSIAVLKIIRCQQDRSNIKDNKDTENDFGSNFLTSKDNTYTNYSSGSDEETEASAQAAAVAQVIEKAAKKRGKKSPLHQSNSLLTVAETRF